MSTYSAVGSVYNGSLAVEKLLVGATVTLWVNDGMGLYDFTVTEIDNCRHGRNIMTVSGRTLYAGFPKVGAKLWLREDGRWFMGIDQDHLAQFEAFQRKRWEEKLERLREEYGPILLWLSLGLVEWKKKHPAPSPASYFG